jgi:hypothetical protein
MDAAALKKEHWPILLILPDADCSRAIEAAFERARGASTGLRVVQILTSDLYHYGHNDLVAVRASKREFLLHIRSEVLQRGQEAAGALENKAREMGIPIDIRTIESEDVVSTALAEVRKDCAAVFLPKQQRKLFPLFKKNLPEYLRKKTAADVIDC